MNKVIIALDFSSKEETFNFLENFKGEKLFVKVGMELYYKEGNALVKELKERGYKIFLDLKLFDIPNTVHKAIKNLVKLEVDFISVHTLGGQKMLEAAQSAVEGTNTKLLGITLLTSISQEDLKVDLNIQELLKKQVSHLMSVAKTSKIYGVVCSPLEAEIAKENNLICVTPGIRLAQDEANDQKRIMTPNDAIKAGSDFLVIGRSITAKDNPQEVYREIIGEIF